MSQQRGVLDRFHRTRKKEAARREQDEMDRKERARKDREGVIGRHNLIDNGEGPSRLTARRCEAPGCKQNEPRSCVDSFFSTKSSITSDVLKVPVDAYLAPAEFDGYTTMAGRGQTMGIEKGDITDDEFDSPSGRMNKGKAAVVDDIDSETEQDLRIRDLQLEKRKLQHDIKEKQKQIDEYQRELSEARAQLIDVSKDREEWKERCQRAKQLIATLEEEKRELRVELEAAEERELQLRSELRKARHQAGEQEDEYERQLRAERRRGDNHKSEVDELRRQLEAVQQVSALQQSDTREGAELREGWSKADEWETLSTVINVDDTNYQNVDVGRRQNHERPNGVLQIRSQKHQGDKWPRHVMVRRPSTTAKVLFAGMY